jgi:hypothetical protein
MRLRARARSDSPNQIARQRRRPATAGAEHGRRGRFGTTAAMRLWRLDSRDSARQGRRPHRPRSARSCLCSPRCPPDGESLLRLVGIGSQVRGHTFVRCVRGQQSSVLTSGQRRL